MQDEKNKEHGCKIFTILFKNNEQQYDFGKAEGKTEHSSKYISVRWYLLLLFFRKFERAYKFL